LRAQPAFWILVESPVHMPPDPPPSVLRPVIIAITMSAAISPYSIAVAPRLSERRRRAVIRIALTPSSFPALVHNAS